MVCLTADSKRAKQPKLPWKLYPHQLAMLYQMMRVERTHQLPSGIQYYPDLPSEQIVHTEQGTIPSRSGLGSTVLILALSKLAWSPPPTISIIHLFDDDDDVDLISLPRVTIPAFSDRSINDRPAMDLIIICSERVTQWQTDIAALGLSPESTLWILDAHDEEQLVRDHDALSLASGEVKRVIILAECANRFELLQTITWNRLVADLIYVGPGVIKCNFRWSIVSDSVHMMPVVAWWCTREFIDASRSIRSTIDAWLPCQDDSDDDTKPSPDLLAIWETPREEESDQFFHHCDKLRGVLANQKIRNRKKIAQIKEQLSDDCMICTSEIRYPVLLTCCQQVICVRCVLKCIALGRGCAMCRADLNSLDHLCAILPEKRLLGTIADPLSAKFETMGRFDVILSLLRRIVSQVVEPRVLVMVSREIVAIELLEYLEGEDTGSDLAHDYYPIGQLSEHSVEHHGISDEEIPLPDYRLIVAHSRYDRTVLPRYPWITHLILAGQDLEFDQRETEIALHPEAIGSTSRPLHRFRICPSDHFPPGCQTITEISALRQAICNPTIVAMDLE